jgi:XRE family aerobic/anaerobic benzoate catabolism transcriptional regulator
MTDKLRKPPQSALLRHVGARVLEERRRRGLSRAQLASRSGVSLRFLGQLETGQANISLQRLEEVATALDVPVGDLLGAQSPALASLLSSRTADEMAEIIDWLTARFSQQKKRRIALLGLRGAGKSTVGQVLAQTLGIAFFELDSLIEDAAGLSLQEIFDLQGPAAFRQLERASLVRFLGHSANAVLATGGGIVTATETYQLLQRACTTVWLRARPEDHWNRVVQQGDQRPMQGHPAAMQELRSLLATRESVYAQADLTVDTGGHDIAAIAGEIAAQLRLAQPDVWPQ